MRRNPQYDEVLQYAGGGGGEAGLLVWVNQPGGGWEFFTLWKKNQRKQKNQDKRKIKTLRGGGAPPPDRGGRDRDPSGIGLRLAATRRCLAAERRTQFFSSTQQPPANNQNVSTSIHLTYPKFLALWHIKKKIWGSNQSGLIRTKIIAAGLTGS